ncbi:MAG: hypothetical protein GC192_21160 [Bacteroidetes bacterium]|nr:hypothetical protein [Bacteroidota bacterium]
MSDKKKQLGDALRTRNTNSALKPPIDLASVENLGREAAPAPSPVKQPVQRTSFNFPTDVYEAMLEHTFRKRITMRDYLVSLIKNDLGI